MVTTDQSASPSHASVLCLLLETVWRQACQIPSVLLRLQAEPDMETASPLLALPSSSTTDG